MFIYEARIEGEDLTPYTDNPYFTQFKVLCSTPELAEQHIAEAQARLAQESAWTTENGDSVTIIDGFRYIAFISKVGITTTPPNAPHRDHPERPSSTLGDLLKAKLGNGLPPAPPTVCYVL